MRKTIIIITDLYLYPIVFGNQRRIIELVKSLRKNEYKLILITTSAPTKNYNRSLRDFAAHFRNRFRNRLLFNRIINVISNRFNGHISEYDVSPLFPVVEEAVKKYNPVAVIAEYIWMAPCLDYVKNGAIKMIDTIDIWHVRKKMYGSLDPWCICTKKEEADLLNKADVVIAIQKNEKKIFQKMVPSKKVICVPHICKIGKRRKSGDSVFFVAGNNSANNAGIEKFLKESWPLIHKELPPYAEL
jgi:hypothetical protein